MMLLRFQAFLSMLTPVNYILYQLRRHLLNVTLDINRTNAINSLHILKCDRDIDTMRALSVHMSEPVPANAT